MVRVLVHGRMRQAVVLLLLSGLILSLPGLVIWFREPRDVVCQQGDVWRGYSGGSDWLALDGHRFGAMNVEIEPPIRTGDRVRLCWLPGILDRNALMSVQRGRQEWHSVYESQPHLAGWPMIRRALWVWYGIPVVLLCGFLTGILRRRQFRRLAGDLGNVSGRDRHPGEPPERRS